MTLAELFDAVLQLPGDVLAMLSFYASHLWEVWPDLYEQGLELQSTSSVS